MHACGRRTSAHPCYQNVSPATRRTCSSAGTAAGRHSRHSRYDSDRCGSTPPRGCPLSSAAEQRALAERRLRTPQIWCFDHSATVLRAPLTRRIPPTPRRSSPCYKPPPRRLFDISTCSGLQPDRQHRETAEAIVPQTSEEQSAALQALLSIGHCATSDLQ